MSKTNDVSRESDKDAFPYDKTARMSCARVYPVIADQILTRTGITRGTCLDVGCGPALLAIALALLSDLRVTALDRSPVMYELACRNIRDRCAERLVVPVIGDVHAIPAGDSAFGLVVSRGSFHSWENLPAAFREIYRVLGAGGMAYIGGGYGSARIRDEVLAGFRQYRATDFPFYLDKTRFFTYGIDEIEASVERAGIVNHRIINDDSGFWILFRKATDREKQDGPLQETPADSGKRPAFHNGFFFPP